MSELTYFTENSSSLNNFKHKNILVCGVRVNLVQNKKKPLNIFYGFKV